MKPKEYDRYVEKPVEYRRTKRREWALPERSENEYKQTALITPYTLDEYKETPFYQLKREQMFYFQSRYRFPFVAEFLETIKDLDSKLLFLIEIKADFEHDIKTMWVARVEQERYAIREQFNFGERCQVEMDKIENLQALARRKIETESLKVGKNKAQNKQADSEQLTTTQQVLAIRYFLKYLGLKDANKSVIARLIAVLRGGKNQRDIYDKVRDPNLHFNKNGDDARKIADLFRKAQQPQIARMIENDLDELNRNRNKF